MSMREISPTHSMDLTTGELRIVSLNDIKQAQERLCGVIVRTPNQGEVGVGVIAPDLSQDGIDVCCHRG